MSPVFAQTDRPTEWVHALDDTICHGEVSDELPGVGICLDHDRRVVRREVKPDASQSIEILHMRDPDSECELRVFLGGVEVKSIIVEDVDPGRGYTREDWDDNITWIKEESGYSPAFRDAAVAARQQFGDSKYVED